MKNERTELVFILDKSGSMAGLEKDTIGGFNSLMEKQLEVEGECRVTTVLFDHEATILHDRIDLRAIKKMGERDYRVGGSTALLDALGSTIEKIISVQKKTAPEFRATKVVVVVITDGEENSSRKYSAKQVKALVEKEKEGYGWQFIFLGANMDAITTAASYGIDADRAVDYISDRRGTELNYRVMSEAIKQIRVMGRMKASCFNEIREDEKKRRSK